MAKGGRRSSKDPSARKRRPKLDAKNPNRIPLGTNRINFKKKEDNAPKVKPKKHNKGKAKAAASAAELLPASEQLSFFISKFESANGLKLSTIELESFKDTCIVELSQGVDQDIEGLSNHIKDAFGTSWKEVLCEGSLLEGKIDPGSPSVLLISISAIRSLELHRGLRPLTGECRAAKLFAKHMKVEEQVAALKSRVNIASGTPSRIKKLIDIDALGLSRLAVILLDMQTDVKGYSLLTLPQVSGEFWDLYKSHFHHRLIQGDLRICLYGPISWANEVKDAVVPEE